MAKVRYMGMVTALVNKKQENIQCKTILGLLFHIRRKYGKEVYDVCKRSYIIVNGESAALSGGYFMKIYSEDIIQIIPVCSGG